MKTLLITGAMTAALFLGACANMKMPNPYFMGSECIIHDEQPSHCNDGR